MRRDSPTPDARFGRRPGPSPMEVIEFQVTGKTRPDIHEKIKHHMAAMEVEDYYVKRIEYHPVVTYIDGRLPDWKADVTVIVTPEVPF